VTLNPLGLEYPAKDMYQFWPKQNQLIAAHTHYTKTIP